MLDISLLFHNVRCWLFTKFSSIFENELKNYRRTIEASLREDQCAKKDYYNHLELERFVGEPVIVICNNLDIPTVGFGVEITTITKAEQPVLKVHDYARNMHVLAMGQIYPYHEERLKELLNSNPKLIRYLAYQQLGRVGFHDEEDKFGDKQNHSQTVFANLAKNGFVARLQEHLKAKQESRELEHADV